jgi:hypothetical protein
MSFMQLIVLASVAWLATIIIISAVEAWPWIERNKP